MHEDMADRILLKVTEEVVRVLHSVPLEHFNLSMMFFSLFTKTRQTNEIGNAERK